MRLALIGDIHVYAPAIHPRRVLMSKRLLSHANHRLSRGRRFDHDLMDPLMDRVRAIRPAAALFSGDVTTTSLEHEFEDVANHLRPLADEMRVVVVPGNHDRYTFGSRRARRVERLMRGLMPDRFPHTEPLGDAWRLLALDAALPQAVMSRGRLGDMQYLRAVSTLRKLRDDQGVAVLCHYPVALPPRFPNSYIHDMREARRLGRELAACKARVVYLHGHIHKPWHLAPHPGDGLNRRGDRRRSVRRAAPFDCVNAGSPCMTGPAYPQGQGFWQIDLPDDPRPPHEVVFTHHVMRGDTWHTTETRSPCT